MTLNIISIIFLIINAALLFWLPRHWAPLPLLAGACYMTLNQGIELGPLHFPIIRLLIAIGLARVIIRREWLVGGMNGLDWLILVFSTWALVSSLFHKDPSSAFIFRLGLAYNVSGIYFLLRIWCRSIDDIKVLCLTTAVLLTPVAVMMIYEKIATYNIFSIFGGVSVIPEIREGKVRASGPFLHPILAGTVGAACLPIMIGFWKENKNTAFIGLVSCLSMIFTCASSGPIISGIAGITALLMWRYHEHMRFVRWMLLLGYIGVDIVMKAPAYYILGRIDLVGGSGGHHRAALIESSFKHINEWWLGGTDYTLHWMPTGVSWSGEHTDITNYYLHLGVVGGLPLMLLFIALLYKGFSFIGKILQQTKDMPQHRKFMIWALGSSLVAHAVNSISVSYFDQSVIFYFITLAAIGSVGSLDASRR